MGSNRGYSSAGAETQSRLVTRQDLLCIRKAPDDDEAQCEQYQRTPKLLEWRRRRGYYGGTDGYPLKQENAVARAWRPKKYLRQDHAKECEQHGDSAGPTGRDSWVRPWKCAPGEAASIRAPPSGRFHGEGQRQETAGRRRARSHGNMVKVVVRLPYERSPLGSPAALRVTFLPSLRRGRQSIT